MKNEGTDIKLLFEIEGKPGKRGLFRKSRSYVAVYAHGIHIELGGESDFYTCEDIFDVYIKEPVVEGVESRETEIDLYEEGEQRNYTLEDGTFPGLAKMMELVLENEWSHIVKKRLYPETVKWFVACNAVVSIASECNPYIFGASYKEPGAISSQREELYESWGFSQKHDLLNMLPQLLDGRAVKSYIEKAKNVELLDDDERILYEKILNEGGERCLWAWDLQRLILLSGLGYVCDYLSWQEALDWSLKAGQKLQTLYRSWDDFMRCYLLGYCFWSGDTLDDDESEAFARERIYKYYKTLPNHPWSIAWNLPLKPEWGNDPARPLMVSIER